MTATVPDWSGRLVVDVTNQFAEYQPTYSGFVDLGAKTGREWVARHLPGASVGKAFNTLYASYIAADPRHAAVPLDVKRSSCAVASAFVRTAFSWASRYEANSASLTRPSSW